MTLLLKFFRRRTLPDFVIWVHNKYVCPRQTKHRNIYNTFYLLYNYFYFETKSIVELVLYPVLNKIFSFWYLLFYKHLNFGPHSNQAVYDFIKTFLLANIYFWTFCKIWFAFKSHVKFFGRTDFFYNILNT